MVFDLNLAVERIPKIRVLQAVEKVAHRRKTSIPEAIKDPKTCYGLGGLTSIASLSDLNSRDILEAALTLRTENIENPNKLVEDWTKEISDSFEALIGNIIQDPESVSVKEYEILTQHLLENSPSKLKDFFSDMGNAISDSDDLIMRLMRSVNPAISDTVEAREIIVNGRKEIVFIDKSTESIVFPDKKASKEVLEIAKKIHSLLPPRARNEEDTAEYEQTNINPASDLTIDIIRSEVEENNFFAAQIHIEEAKTRGLKLDGLKDLKEIIYDKKVMPEIPGKVITINYSEPIPIGNNHMWIVRGDDLNKVSNRKYKSKSFYLVGSNTYSEVVKIPSSEILASSICNKFGYKHLNNKGLTISYSGNNVIIDLSKISFETASDERLVAAHKALVGVHSRQKVGLIQEAYDQHNNNARALQRLEEYSEKLEEFNPGDINGFDEFKEFILEIMSGDDPLISSIDMNGAAGREVEETKTELSRELANHTYEICMRDLRADTKGESIGLTNIVTKDDFLKIVKSADSEDFFDFILLQTILRWNLAIRKDEAEKICMDSYFDLFNDSLTSHDPNITGTENEINNRLQKKIEEYANVKLPQHKFKIDNFSGQKHPVTVEEKGAIKEIIINPELAYDIVKGSKSSWMRFSKAIDTVMCYLY